MSEVLDKLKSGGLSDTDLMHKLAKLSGYKRQVPGILEFMDNPYYLGKILHDGSESSVYPIWRDAAVKLYPSPYHCIAVEVYLTGGIGLGKSTFAKICTMYTICKLLCMESPHRYYGLLPTTVIRYMLMNATAGLAYDVLYAEIIEWVENSPFFTEALSSDKRSLFRNNIDIGMGSRGKHALGQATVGAIFSEINDMTVVGGQAEDNFDTIATRMNSRFGGKGKDLVGNLILDSSNKGTKSFIDSRLEEKASKGIKDFIVFRFAHWDAKMHLGTYSGEKFEMYAGDESRDPFLLDDTVDPKFKLNLKPERIISVPIEHKQEFVFNPIKAIRDLAGVSTFGTFSFITSVTSIKSTFTVPNPVTKDLIILDFFDQRQKLISYIPIEMLIKINKAKRFIHIDLGLKFDSTGIGCSFLKGYKDVETFDEITGRSVFNKEPIFQTEWVMEIKPIPGHEVAIYKIKEFILEARKMGYPIKVVSTDGFQSSNLRQDLLLRKVETKLISCDRNKDPYNHLRNAILEGRVIAPSLPKLITEVSELEEGDQKFDHSINGTKDLLDGMTGSIWSCAQHIHELKVMTTSDDIKRSLDVVISSSINPQDALKNKLADMLKN